MLILLKNTNGVNKVLLNIASARPTDLTESKERGANLCVTCVDGRTLFLSTATSAETIMDWLYSRGKCELYGSVVCALNHDGVKYEYY